MRTTDRCLSQKKEYGSRGRGWGVELEIKEKFALI